MLTQQQTLYCKNFQGQIQQSIDSQRLYQPFKPHNFKILKQACIKLICQFCSLYALYPPPTYSYSKNICCITVTENHVVTVQYSTATVITVAV